MMNPQLAASPDLADLECVLVAGSAESVASLGDLVAAAAPRPEPVLDDSAPLPVALTPFRDRGHYRGAFASVADLGNILRPVLGIRAGLPRAEREWITRELCLRGDLWIAVQGGVVHVFGRPGSDADLCLAGERPPLVDFDSRPGPTELRRQVQT